jgi:hypothetical protein
VGWSAVVEPYRHGVTAIARTDTTLLAWDRAALLSYAGSTRVRPAVHAPGADAGGDRLRAARLRLVASRYDAEVLAIQALLDQHGEQLPVTSPLHKIPHYLQNRLTFADALAVVELLQSSDDRGERELADLVAEILEGVRRELRIYQRLQSIYELVAGAPDDVDPVALREQSCRQFVELFDDLPHVIAGQEHLPAQDRVDHRDEPPVQPRRQRAAQPVRPDAGHALRLLDAAVPALRAGTGPGHPRGGPREYGHRRYYDRLGYIYVSSRVPGEESARRPGSGELPGAGGCRARLRGSTW